jgi:hypothetical protein
MKRYYLVRDEDMPTVEEDFGTFHYIDLASHGNAGYKWNLLCLTSEHIQPKVEWKAFPPLYDVRTTLINSPVPQEALVDVGLTGEETTLEAVVCFGEINPLLSL